MEKQEYPVIKGAESFFFPGNRVGVLLCHGFLGTPQSVEEMGRAIAAKGFTVSCPRLPGHGTHAQDLARFSADDWFAEIERAYLELKADCTAVFVIGQSMGGTLTLDLASRHTGINGIVLLNPAIDIPAFETFRTMPATGFVAEDRPDIKRRDVVEITYSEAPIRAYHELFSYLDAVAPKLGRVRCAVTVFVSPDDHVVPPGNTDFILGKVSSETKRKYSLPNSYHIASMDHDMNFIVEKACGFMTENAALAERV